MLTIGELRKRLGTMMASSASKTFYKITHNQESEMKERIGLFFVMCGWLVALIVALVITFIAACIKIPYGLLRELVWPSSDAI